MHSAGSRFHVSIPLPKKKGFSSAKNKKKVAFWLSVLALSKAWLYFPADASRNFEMEINHQKNAVNFLG